MLTLTMTKEDAIIMSKLYEDDHVAVLVKPENYFTDTREPSILPSIPFNLTPSFATLPSPIVLTGIQK
jgi:hypothetical protein